MSQHEFLPPDERRTRGKALRETTPREAQGHWKAGKDRRDIVDILEESSRGRVDHLIPVRYGRMMQTPFTFYRGAASIMAADLATTPSSGVRTQICGDAHLSNFGGFATPERQVVFDINDFDETLPGPWEWDLKRLAASIVVAGRQIRLPESDCVRAARATARSYRERMSNYASMRALDVWYDAISVDRVAEELMRPRPASACASASRRRRPRARRSSCSPSWPSIARTRRRSRTTCRSSSTPRWKMRLGWRTVSGWRSRATASRSPSMCARCSTATGSATSRSRSSASAASERAAP